MTCGQRIKQERKNRHMSQEDLAEKLEVSRQTVSKWETDAARPTKEKREQLSVLLELPPEIWSAPPPPEQAALRRWKTATVVLAAMLCLTLVLGAVLWPRPAKENPPVNGHRPEDTALPVNPSTPEDTMPPVDTHLEEEITPSDISEVYPPMIALKQRRDFDFGNWPLGEYSLDNVPLLKDPEWIQDHCRGVGSFEYEGSTTALEIAWADPREENGTTLYNVYLIYAIPDADGNCDWQILYRMAEDMDDAGIAEGLEIGEFCGVLNYDGYKISLKVNDLGIWTSYIIPGPDGIPRLMSHTSGGGAIEYDVDEDGQKEIVSIDGFQPSCWEITDTTEGNEGAFIYTLSAADCGIESLQFAPEMGGFVVADTQNAVCARYILQNAAMVRLPITDFSVLDYPDVLGTEITFITDVDILSDGHDPDDVIYSEDIRITHRQQAYLALQELYNLTGLTVDKCYCAANEYGVVFSLLADGFEQRSFYSMDFGENYGGRGIPGLYIAWQELGNDWSPLAFVDAVHPESGVEKSEVFRWYYDRLDIFSTGEADYANFEELYLLNGDSYLASFQDTEWGKALTSLHGPYPDGIVNH